MEAKDIAIKLYTEFKKVQDLNLQILRSYLLLKDASINEVSEVIGIYEDLLNQKAFVAVVKTRTAMDDKQKQEIEKKVTESVKAEKVYFKYVVNKDMGSTLEVEINDKVFKYSI